MVMNRSLQEVNIQNMNVELVAQMFKNYQSNVLFHLEGKADCQSYGIVDSNCDSHGESQRPNIGVAGQKYTTSTRYG